MDTALAYHGGKGMKGLAWQGDKGKINLSIDEMRRALLELDQTVWVVEQQDAVGLVTGGNACPAGAGLEIIGMEPALPMDRLGDPSFCETYGTRFAYYAGAMANGIASEGLVVALGKAGLMGCFGAGGVSPSRIEAAIQKIKAGRAVCLQPAQQPERTDAGGKGGRALPASSNPCNRSVRVPGPDRAAGALPGGRSFQGSQWGCGDR